MRLGRAKPYNQGVPRLFAAFLLVFVLAAAYGQSSDAGARSLIPKSILAKVRKSKFRVLVPTYVPPGFKYQSASLATWAEDSPKDDPALMNWTAVYVNAKTKEKLIIQMASDGLGDYIFSLPNGDTIEPTKTLAGKSPAFGPYEILVASQGSYRCSATYWTEVSIKTYPRHVMVIGDGMNSAVVKRVIDGLRWLK